MISWEQTRYSANFADLPQFLQGRLNNGIVVNLRGQRTASEVRELITRRVNAAFTAAGVAPDCDNPLDPLPGGLPQELAGGSTRAVLAKTREKIRLMAPDAAPVGPSDDDDQVEHLETAWEAHLSNSPMPDELDDRELLELTAWACTEAKTADGNPASALANEGANGSVSWRELDVPSTRAELQVFALTRNSQGGGLLKQIKSALVARGGRTPVGLRLAKFPGNQQTETVRRMIELFTPVGYRVEGSERDVQTILAFREFVASDVSRAVNFARWRSQAKVLEQLSLVRGVLGLPSLPNGNGDPAPRNGGTRPSGNGRTGPGRPNGEQGAATEASSPVTATDQHSITIGIDHTRGASVAIPMGALTRHTAVLGGSGSGKTTLILRMVEQCLLRGVPAVLVDRKGDFSTYGDPRAWSAVRDPDCARLREQIVVSLFTPGKLGGRPLALRLLPQDYWTLDEEDRGEASRSAAEALGQMLGMKDTPADRERREVLRQAIDQIGREIRGPLDLSSLIDGLASDHQGLLEKLLRLDPKSRHRQRLIPMLEQLRLSRGYLFSDGEQLDFASLIQPAGATGRTRLAVVSLAFLPDMGDQQFFVSRLLAEARRFCRVKPSKGLQVLLVLDEADVFMPATSKPSTKDPLLDLLRRARSGGMGLVIGTQSPGDLDYKGRDNITTWALGRIQDNTALDKIKFVAEGTALDVREVLPRFTAGRFLLRTDGLGPCEVQAHRSIVETTQVPEERIVELAVASRMHKGKSSG
jgi:DNA helicase HerA-like ATPase